MRDYKLYLDDIITASENIEKYISDYSLSIFEKDQKTIDAVIRNIEIIGDAVRPLPQEVKNKYPNIAWRESAAMRNIIAHEYFGIDMNIIWKTTQEDIPKLKKEIINKICS